MFTIIDLGISNITSVANAFSKIGSKTNVTSDKSVVSQAKALVLPGVGAYQGGMSLLDKAGLTDVIRDRVLNKGVSILGICLGMQLLANQSSEHGIHKGLGLLPGVVEKLESKDQKYRVPNIGWSITTPKKKGVLFDSLATEESYYYVHSYHFVCENSEDVASTIDYSQRSVTVAVERDNIFGVQFHPEKSQDSGLNLLHRYASKWG